MGPNKLSTGESQASSPSALCIRPLGASGPIPMLRPAPSVCPEVIKSWSMFFEWLLQCNHLWLVLSNCFSTIRQGALDQLQSVIKPFLKGIVKQSASDRHQSAIKPFRKGFGRAGVSDQLQSVIKPCRKGFARQNASDQPQGCSHDQLQSVIKPVHSCS